MTSKQATLPVNTLSALLHTSAKATEDEYEAEQAFRIGSRAELAANSVHALDIFYLLFNVEKFKAQVLISRLYEPDAEDGLVYQIKYEAKTSHGAISVQHILAMADEEARNAHFFTLSEEDAEGFLKSSPIFTAH